MLRNNPAADGSQDGRRRVPPTQSRGARQASFTGSSYDPDTRSFDAVLSSGAEVKRWGFIEALLISDEAIDLSRVSANLVPFLDSHNTDSIDAVLGSVSNVRIENGLLLATITLIPGTRADQIAELIRTGVLTGISIGYCVNQWQLTAVDDDADTETWTATRWELREASLVSVPADASAGVRSAGPVASTGEPATTQEDEDMTRSDPSGGNAAAPVATPAAAPASGAQRAADPASAPAAADPAPATDASRFTASQALTFQDQARAFGLDTRAAELVQQNERGDISMQVARETILREAAERQRTRTDGQRATAPSNVSVQVMADGLDRTRDAVVDALSARLLGRSGQVSEAGRPYLRHGLLDIARERAGLSHLERDIDVILRAANTTSDFPVLLSAVANKVLLERYQTAAPTYQKIARRRDFRDFKPHNALRISDFPLLEAYTEDGEIKAGTVSSSNQTIALGSYGKIFRLTRQALVNDDLGAFDEMLSTIGIRVGIFENNTFYAMKAQNGGKGPTLTDGKPVFDTAHSNLAGAGTAIDIPNMSAARAAVRKQKNLDGVPINLAPTILLVSADQETAAQQLIYPINPTQESNVNPFSNKLEVVADANLTGNAWETYVDPALAPIWQYGYLQDAPGPRMLMDQPFNTDGYAWRVTLDFGCGAVGAVGAWRNPGQ